MRKQKSGLIINISTYAMFVPDSALSTSGVFRAGLAAFIKLFTDKYAPDNIRMNNVLPGFISTFAEKDEIWERIPLGRYGTVDEISDRIGLLASEGAGYITGQNLHVVSGVTHSV